MSWLTTSTKWETKWVPLGKDGTVQSALPASALQFRFTCTRAFHIRRPKGGGFMERWEEVDTWTAEIDGKRLELLLRFYVTVQEDPLLGALQYVIEAASCDVVKVEGEVTVVGQFAVRGIDRTSDVVGMPVTVVAGFEITSAILEGRFERGIKLTITGIKAVDVRTRTRPAVAAVISLTSDDVTGCLFVLSDRTLRISFPDGVSTILLVDAPTELNELRARGNALYLLTQDALYISYDGGMTFRRVTSDA